MMDEHEIQAMNRLSRKEQNLEKENEQLREEIARITEAVAEHRRQRRDDRCWRDDDTLYAAVFPGEQMPDTSLPPEAEFLESCARSCRQFWRERQRPEDRDDHSMKPHEMTMAQLEAEVIQWREAEAKRRS